MDIGHDFLVAVIKMSREEKEGKIIAFQNVAHRIDYTLL